MFVGRISRNCLQKKKTSLMIYHLVQQFAIEYGLFLGRFFLNPWKKWNKNGDFP
jgi:hypothetical protein